MANQQQPADDDKVSAVTSEYPDPDKAKSGEHTSEEQLDARSIETLDIEPIPGDGRIIVIGLKNSGRTPARILDANVTVRSARTVDDGGGRGGLRIEPIPPADLPSHPVYDAGDFVPPDMLVAGETSRWRHYAARTVGDDNWTLLGIPGKDRGTLYIYGKVRYTDEFKPKKPHVYGWAREYDPVLSKIAGDFRFSYLSKRGYNYHYSYGKGQPKDQPQPDKPGRPVTQ
jgi:hypothetical protein